ncbi:phage Gp37/Gp68 family protein [Methylobacterium sp.]|uniref:phage Gp37/Gp68 family protein n=1 Tax=Methylobacterium sp. TaxID=409 RepID=UPI0025E5FAB0|nr:phage Gp37/Gp68 family protein [Methylobacterium sp.]MBY0259560.1 phage Gp37/Gp68 family protein [Methylobacterium sp.]
MSKIEWTEKTWNPIVGCSVVSSGCTNCYAMKMAARLERMGMERYRGLTQPTKAGPVWTGEMRLVDEALNEPLRRRKPTMWFVNSMSDLFHDSVPEEWIAQVFAIMALAPQHTFQVLTKRSDRMHRLMAGPKDHSIWHPKLWHRSVLPNVWLGVSAEDQRRADERVPDLLTTPAAVRFVSAEPLLGPIDFSAWLEAAGLDTTLGLSNPGLDWLIVGGESGPGARPMHPVWARSIRDQCAAASVPFFHKQNGAYEVVVDRDKDDPDWRRDYSYTLNDRRAEIEWLNVQGGRGFHGEGFHVMRRVGKARAGRHLDGIEHNGLPEARR